jgi:N-acetyl-gamma-glutamyl-phosphate reductase
MPTSANIAASTRTVALIGARGHTGAEVIRLLDRHPHFRLAAATSRELAGTFIAAHVEGATTKSRFEDVAPEVIAARGYDVVILALPNGKSQPWVEALGRETGVRRPEAGTADARNSELGSRNTPVLIDLSADWRFDEGGRGGWVYGLPEHFRDRIRGANRIANPGCYATGMQVALRPVLDLLDGPPHVFGVSGYSGAGTTPSDRNNPDTLRDNLMPYSLIDHTHEREAARHLGHPIVFHPHVAPFFRGITLTISMRFNRVVGSEELLARLTDAYAFEPLVRVQREIPLVRDIAGRHEVVVGGVEASKDGRRGVIVATIDNLLKGAATQAVQNMNLACGCDEFAGIAV